ncbi:MAG TPA: LysM peptidoglycan-binding domain-containing protein [Vicinamibacteria bacterium]
MSTRTSRAGIWAVALFAGVTLASAQQSPDQIQPGGEIVIPPHWSPYQAPNSYPEGTRLHIIVRGDTLWDLANTYFQNPFLWPQLWDANRYITDPHWIYPGDPLVIPDLDLLRAAGEEPGAAGPGEEGAGEGIGEEGAGVAGGPTGPSLYPVSEEDTIQCVAFIGEREDEDFRIFETEHGFDVKVMMSVGDIVYVNRGRNDGVQAGDEFYMRSRVRSTSHGWLINTTGWLVILAAQEETAIAEVIHSCRDALQDNYLVPFEPVPVPLIPYQDPVHRLTPETGRDRGQIIASIDDIVELGSFGTGNIVSIDVGEEQGIIPGSIFTVFRYNHPDAPRKVLGELAVLTVHPRTSTAKITLAYDFMAQGDLIEVK